MDLAGIPSTGELPTMQDGSRYCELPWWDTFILIPLLVVVLVEIAVMVHQQHDAGQLAGGTWASVASKVEIEFITGGDHTDTHK